ncbi:helix-turn-helix transcriptional regulator [Lentibacillus salicampi]|uniref:XRE family transcriptional regulator n=1 Tax=Lentibacillus salicampi TaxID=175306 RepID=A0A4Y9ADM8_9BACI|nr:helix-turn-helix transcriptional regulator [Lentibacillus salicampi]TFJ93432.1 XRE family transcriptional regulator [Lentibacillus salicampi]
MEKISAEKLGNLVEEKRLEKGFTQEQLGEKAKINRQIIGRIENNKHVPSITQLNNLMDVLNFNLHDLTDEKEESNVFVAMMGKAETPNEKKWLEDMTAMMLCLRKHVRIRNAMNHEFTVKS